MSGWWSRSPSATAEVLWSACHWQDLDPCFLVSGSLCALSQGCAYKTGREFIAGWVRICLPHLCGGLGSSEAENNRLCLLLARRELATHARKAFSPKCSIATLKLVAATWGETYSSPWGSQTRVELGYQYETACKHCYAGLFTWGGNSVLCMSAKWSSLTFSEALGQMQLMCMLAKQKVRFFITKLAVTAGGGLPPVWTGTLADSLQGTL